MPEASLQGTSEAELFASMRRLLLHNIADAVRRDEGTAKRQVGRERSLDDGQLPHARRT